MITKQIMHIIVKNSRTSKLKVNFNYLNPIGDVIGYNII